VDGHVGTAVEGDPSFAARVADEPHAVVDAEVGRLLLVAGPVRAVADDRQFPVAVPQLREREEDGLEVGGLVEGAPGDDVRRVVGRRRRLDGLEVDPLRDDARAVGGDAQRLHPRGDEPGRGDDGARRARGSLDPAGLAERLVAEPVEDQRGAREGRPRPRRERGARGRGRRVDRVRPVAGEHPREARDERPDPRRDVDPPVGDAVDPVGAPGVRAVPELRGEDQHLVAARREVAGDRLRPVDPLPVDPVAVGPPARLVGDDGHAHTVTARRHLKNPTGARRRSGPSAASGPTRDDPRRIRWWAMADRETPIPATTEYSTTTLDVETPDPPRLRGPQDPGEYDAVDEPDEWTGDESPR
jgi:hypothetical protein